MERPSWAPPDVDLDRPSSARVYDYMLGGSHNFGVDRQMAEQLLSVDPRIAPTAYANRAFMRRAVEYLTAAGVRQFLDLGSGIPTVGNVHQVAQGIAPDARVVYVDLDPVAVAHSRAIIGSDDRVAVLQTDITDPATVLASPAVQQTLDLSAPVAVLLVGVLHFVPDEADPAVMIRTLRDAVVPGSYLVISQAALPEEVSSRGREVLEEYRKATPVALRSAGEVATFFAGYSLVDPGVTHVAAWRPDPEDADVDLHQLMPVHAGVGVKPG